tara:strand:+ start:1469 stop:3187 length:1719 start_codon:yes stop_codon:yes gene_type:complete
MKKFILTALVGAGFAASAATYTNAGNITVDTTWTAGDEYILTNQVFVTAGASLTIEAGVTVKGLSDSDTGLKSLNGGGGSLAVCRGAKIYANGTAEAPITFTSSNDNGTRRDACNEWGNITIMGKGLISASSDQSRTRAGNTKKPDGTNEVQMEGLTGSNTLTYYGGNDDSDDSGTLAYVNLRYGGNVIGQANELNGLSLGGIGSETDIHHIEIYNNVDDGIEIWGGKVNLKYFSIWNIGDDSLDVDQGWRGTAQFGLIVQGASQAGKQGSGVGDNCIEIDGAEDSDAQPLTSCRIANVTVVGNKLGGDGGATYRDNARIQYSNMIFMNLGEELIRLDNQDGDGGSGYGNGMTEWAATWTTSADTYEALNFTNNIYGSLADLYTAQYAAGNLNEMINSVFYNNTVDSDDKASEVGVLSEPSNVSATASPIVAAEFTLGSFHSGAITAPVYTNINPLAQNEAVTRSGAVSDANIVRADYAGGFSATHNWLIPWSTTAQYGITTGTTNGVPAASAATGVVISFDSVDGTTYAIQSRSSNTDAWVEVATVKGTGATLTYGDESLTDAEFYQVVIK